MFGLPYNALVGMSLQCDDIFFRPFWEGHSAKHHHGNPHLAHLRWFRTPAVVESREFRTCKTMIESG